MDMPSLPAQLSTRQLKYKGTVKIIFRFMHLQKNTSTPLLFENTLLNAAKERSCHY